MMDRLSIVESACGAPLLLRGAKVAHRSLCGVATLLVRRDRDLQALMLGHRLFVLNWSDDSVLRLLLLLFLRLIDFRE